MALNQLSKAAFAKSLEEMIETTPIERIRVTKIAEQTNTSPQAFYYHFRDKYDLIAWIYLNDYAEVMYNNKEPFSPEQIIQFMTQLYKRKTFYQKAFTDKSQNAIEDYMIEYNLDLTKKAVERYQQSPLTPQQQIAILYHQYGVIGLFKDWINDKINMDLEHLAQFQYERTPEFLKNALSHYEYQFNDNL